MNKMDKRLSTSAVALSLEVSPATVAVWCREGKIRADKQGSRWWIPEGEVEKLKHYAQEHQYKRQYMRRSQPARLFGTVRCPWCGRIIVIKHERIIPLLRCSCGWTYKKEPLKPVSRYILPQVRRRVLERAKGRCELCGRKGKLEIHHFLPPSMGGASHPLNLIALCPECHGRQFLHRRHLQAISHALKGELRKGELLWEAVEKEHQATLEAFLRILSMGRSR